MRISEIILETYNVNQAISNDPDIIEVLIFGKQTDIRFPSDNFYVSVALFKDDNDVRIDFRFESNSSVEHSFATDAKKTISNLEMSVETLTTIKKIIEYFITKYEIPIVNIYIDKKDLRYAKRLIIYKNTFRTLGYSCISQNDDGNNFIKVQFHV